MAEKHFDIAEFGQPRPRRAMRGDRRGSMMVEFAIVAPVFFVSIR